MAVTVAPGFFYLFHIPVSFPCQESNVVNPDSINVALFPRNHLRTDLYENSRLHISSSSFGNIHNAYISSIHIINNHTLSALRELQR